MDYLGLGGRDYVGNPKQPTISIYQLNGDRYQQPSQFRGDVRIISSTFSDLILTAERVFAAADYERR